MLIPKHGTRYSTLLISTVYVGLMYVASYNYSINNVGNEKRLPFSAASGRRKRIIKRYE